MRVVSLVPSLTETLFALGAGPSVVGVTRFCTEPAAEVAGLPKVGGTKRSDVDAILDLEPDLVVMNEEENRAADAAALQAAGVDVLVTFPQDWDGALATIRQLADATQRPAAPLLEGLDRERREAEELVAGRRVRVFFPVWKQPWIAFNARTYCHDILTRAGGENVFADHADRYPRVLLDEVLARAPEIALLPSEPYDFGEAHATELRTAVPDVRLIDGAALSWYGPRQGAGLLHIAHTLWG